MIPWALRSIVSISGRVVNRLKHVVFSIRFFPSGTRGRESHRATARRPSAKDGTGDAYATRTNAHGIVRQALSICLIVVLVLSTVAPAVTVGPAAAQTATVGITGAVDRADGSTAVGDKVFAIRGGSVVANSTTDAAGNYTLGGLDPATEYDRAYLQTNGTTRGATGYFPRDGSPDLFGLVAVNTSQTTDAGRTSLPPANVLNITVVNESGAPVPNALVGVAHTNNDGQVVQNSQLGPPFTTGSDGRVHPSPSAAGIELSGNVTLRVFPPRTISYGGEGATTTGSAYVEREYSRTVQMDQDRDVRITLAEAETSSGALVVDDTSPAVGTPVNISVENVTGPTPSFYNWRVDGAFRSGSGASLIQVFQTPGAHQVEVTAYSSTETVLFTAATTVEVESPADGTLTATPTPARTNLDRVAFALTNLSGVGAGDFYSWQFGDGNGTTTTHPNASVEHIYTDRGNYTVTVTARNGTSEALLLQKTLELRVDEAANGTLRATPENPTPGETVTLDVRNVSTAPGVSVDRYDWDVDGDGTVDTTTTGNSTTHAYPVAGAYTPRVVVRNATGTTLLTDSTTVTVEAEVVLDPADSWPQFGYDDANTGSAPATQGPAGPVVERWNQSAIGTEMFTPTVAGDRVYLTNSNSVVAYNRTNGAVLWSTSFTDFSAERDDLTSSVTVVGDRLYVGGYFRNASGVSMDRVYVLDAETGAKVWTASRNVQNWGGFFDDGIDTMAPTVDNGTLYMLGEAGDTLYAIDATGSAHREQWNHSFAGEVVSAPAVANGEVYVATDSGLFSFDADTGATDWSTSLSNYDGGAPTVAGGTVFIADGGQAEAFDATDGSEQWSKPATAATRRGSVTVVGDLVIVPSADRSTPGVVARYRADGTEAWNVSADAQVFGAPAVAGDRANGTGPRVYFGSFNGTVYGVDATDGSSLWTYSFGKGTGEPVFAPVSVVDGVVYVRSGTNGVLNRSLTAIGEPEALASVDGDLEADPTLADADVEVVNFSVTNRTGSVDSYDWTFGDGETRTTATANTSHVYGVPGNYTPGVTARDRFGRALFTAQVGVTVEPAASGRLLVDPETADINVTRVALRVVDLDLPDGYTEGDIRYDWAFGDGGTDFTRSNGTNHTYRSFGAFTPDVTVRDASTEAALFTANNTTSVVDRVPPTLAANAPATVPTGVAFNVTANATDNDRVANYTFATDEGQTNTTTANRTQLTLGTPGDHVVRVSAVDPSGNENRTNLTVTASATVDLQTDVTAPAEQNLAEGPATANVTVLNNGTKTAENVSVRLRARTRTSYFDSSVRTYDRDIGTLVGGANRTVQVNLTAWFRGNFSAAYPTVSLYAVADPEGVVDESFETNNVSEATTDIGASDLDVAVYAPRRTIPKKEAMVTLYLTNYGSAESPNHTVELDFGDGSTNQTLSVPRLKPNERVVVTRNHSFAVGSHTLTARITDEPLAPDGNVDRDFTRTSAFEIDARLSGLDTVQEGETFYVRARGRTNYGTSITGNLSLPDGLELAAGERAEKTTSRQTTYHSVRWEVTATEKNATPYDIEVEFDAEGSAANDTEDVRVVEPKIRVSDTAAVNFSGNGNATTTIDIRNETTYDHRIEITSQLGAQGRTLAGLDYLIEYPHGCVEQVTSPMLSALNTDQYYRSNTPPTGYNEGRVDRAVAGGVGIMTTGDNAQHANGAWSMWGSDPEGDVYYTVYAMYGVSAVRNDPVQGARGQVATDIQQVDFNESVLWLADQQAADGRIPNDKYYFEDDNAMTGFTLVALAQAGPYNATARTAADQLRADAAAYLAAQQAADGSWQDDGEPNAMSTALAVWGLEASGVNTPAVEDAIDAGVNWLVANQDPNGGWSETRSSSWAGDGVDSETSGYALQALNASGLPNGNSTVQDGVRFLVGVYDDEGSWGHTRATAAAIDALLVTDQGGSAEHDATVTFGTTADGILLTKNISMETTDGVETVSLSDTERQTLRGATGPITVTVDTVGTGLLVVSVENDQLVSKDEYAANGGVV